MDSFQAKIGWNSLSKRENNNYCSVPFQPDQYQKFQKNSKKIKKIKKIQLWIHFKPKQARIV